MPPISFRELSGPHDPEIARTLRKKTLRAKYGIDRVRNAIHCTDLPEDGVLEVIITTLILERILLQHSLVEMNHRIEINTLILVLHAIPLQNQNHHRFLFLLQ